MAGEETMYLARPPRPECRSFARFERLPLQAPDLGWLAGDPDVGACWAIIVTPPADAALIGPA